MSVRVQVTCELGIPEMSHGSRRTTNEEDVPGGSAASPRLALGEGEGASDRTISPHHQVSRRIFMS